MATVIPTGYPATVKQVREAFKDWGTALDFTAGVASLGTENPFTGSFYITLFPKWFGNNGAYQQLINKRDSYIGSDMMFGLYLDQTTDILSVDTTNGIRSSTATLRIGEYTPITWVHNLTADKEQFFIDGDKIAETEISSCGTGTGAVIYVGATQDPAIENFNGVIDEIVIGTGIPTWEQVIAQHKKHTYTDVWGYYKFDEESGTTATDSSGNGHDGTITDATYVAH